MSLDDSLLCAELSAIGDVTTELHVEIRAEGLLARAQTHHVIENRLNNFWLVCDLRRTRGYFLDRVQAIAGITREHADVEHLLGAHNHILVTVLAFFQRNCATELRVGVLALGGRRRRHRRRRRIARRLHYVFSVEIHVAGDDSIDWEIDHNRSC